MGAVFGRPMLKVELSFQYIPAPPPEIVPVLIRRRPRRRPRALRSAISIANGALGTPKFVTLLRPLPAKPVPMGSPGAFVASKLSPLLLCGIRPVDVTTTCADVGGFVRAKFRTIGLEPPPEVDFGGLIRISFPFATASRSNESLGVSGDATLRNGPNSSPIGTA